jgi:uncharacterized protein
MLTWENFLVGLSLLLVFEGLMPFAMPNKWRAAILSIAALKPSQIRIIGFVSMISGLLLLSFVS